MLNRKHNVVSGFLTYVILTVFFVIVAYPLVWTVYSSFKAQWEIFLDPFAFPSKWFFGNYVEAWARADFGIYFANSVIITIPSVLGILLFSSLAGYAFARFRFAGDKFLFLFFLVGIMVPSQAIIISAFQVVTKLKMVNTYWALIFTYFSWASVGIFIIRGFFVALPKEVIEAAQIDGCSEFQIYRKIALPLAKPAIATVAIFYFVWIWNDFIYPLIYIQDASMNTITLGIMLIKGRYRVDWGLQCAGLSIATLPALIVYLVFQDKFVKGLTAGALKG